MRQLAIEKIRTDGGTQPRAMINMITVQEYTDAIKVGATFPPVIVFYDGTDHWLADGFHRLEAFTGAAQETISCDIRQGTRRDAILYSVGANAAHGLQRSQDDKRRAIKTLLLDSEWTQWSNRAIATQVRCDHKTVGSVRRQLEQSGLIETHNKRRTMGGRLIDTTQIGTTQTLPTGEFPSQSDDPKPVATPTPEAIRQELQKYIDSDERITFIGPITEFLENIAKELGASFFVVQQIWMDLRFTKTNLFASNQANEEVLEEQVLEEQVLEEQVLEEQVLEEQVLEEQVLEEQVLEEQVLEEQVLEEQVLEEQVLEEQVLEEQVLEEQVLEEQVLEEQVLEEQVLEEQVLEEQVLEEQVLEEQVLEEQVALVLIEDVTEEETREPPKPKVNLLENIPQPATDETADILLTLRITERQNGSSARIILSLAKNNLPITFKKSTLSNLWPLLESILDPYN